MPGKNTPKEKLEKEVWQKRFEQRSEVGEEINFYHVPSKINTANAIQNKKQCQNNMCTYLSVKKAQIRFFACLEISTSSGKCNEFL